MKMSRGSFNLMVLGAGAVAFATATTLISLKIYHDSGDIYLDRSRPGYLPDEEEAAEQTENTSGFVFSDTGEINADELQEYLKELQNLNQRIEGLANPYSPAPLSDESLGIPSAETEE